MEDVIITGLDVKPRSYATAAADGGHVSEDAKIEEQQTRVVKPCSRYVSYR